MTGRAVQTGAAACILGKTGLAPEACVRFRTGKGQTTRADQAIPIVAAGTLISACTVRHGWASCARFSGPGGAREAFTTMEIVQRVSRAARATLEVSGPHALLATGRASTGIRIRSVCRTREGRTHPRARVQAVSRMTLGTLVNRRSQGLCAAGETRGGAATARGARELRARFLSRQ